MSSFWSKLSQRTIAKPQKPLALLSGNLKAALLTLQHKLRGTDFGYFYSFYDKLTGLEHVRRAHEEVAEAEKCFVDRQLERRNCQTECFRLEEARTHLNTRLDGVSRSDERFLQLVTELHELSRQHKTAKERLSATEFAEQTAFEHFSRSLRLSQAEERVHASRMRQWSVGFSVLAGVIGFGATWIRFSLLHPTRLSSPALLTPTNQLSMNPMELSSHPPDLISQALSPTIAELRIVSEQLHQNLGSAVAELRAVNEQLHQHIQPSAFSGNPFEHTSKWLLVGCISASVIICSLLFGHR